jgi:hypothetical protein
MRYHKGDRVTAQREIEGIDVPHVEAGTTGTVVATTVLGRPKRVFFAIQTVWGPKHFHVNVGPRDVR